MRLRVDGISKRFGGLQAVNRVSFSAEDGRVTSLIGPNGAGKTTIFNCITGVFPPDEGAIWVDQRRITGLKPHRVVTAGVARTFQDLRLFQQLSVLDNVLFGRQGVRGEQPLVAVFGFGLRRQEERQHREAALRVLEYVGLAANASTQARNLSYAEQKLLSLARVLATDSPLLLLDEPASGLDRHSVQALNALIRDLSKEGKTILLVEHNFAIVREVSDHVVFLDHGEVVAEGTPEAVMKDPRLTEIYFGTFVGARRRTQAGAAVP